MKTARNNWLKQVRNTPLGKKSSAALRLDEIRDDSIASAERLIWRSLSADSIFKKHGLPVAKPEARRMRELAGLGYMFLCLVSDSDDSFFSRLAGLLRNPKKRISHKDPKFRRKINILHFCEHRYPMVGSIENPCDGNALWAFLKAQGYENEYDYIYDNEIPKGVRNDCKSLGIVLESKRRKK